MRITPGEFTGAESIVSDTSGLKEVCRDLKKNGPFALDMEFASESTYYPELHLVQVANPRLAAIIDPLSVETLDPLWDLVLDPSIKKITHAGRQDGEIVFLATGKAPKAWMDTQVAAALLGMGDQIGYANLVNKVLGHRVKKTERVTDWSRRPLSDGQVRYALDDVVYLPEIYDRLTSELESLGRMSWLDEELEFYTSPATYERDPQNAWRRVSGKRGLDRRGLGILMELAAWREHEAGKRNRPRNRVISDHVLVEVAERRPKEPEDLKPLRRLHSRELAKSGAALVAAVARGLALDETELPKVSRGTPEDPDLVLTAHLMEVLLRLRARENSIAPSYLSNQKGIKSLVDWLAGRSVNGTTPPLLEGWRRELVGEDLESLFRGELGLEVDPESKRPRIRKNGNESA